MTRTTVLFALLVAALPVASARRAVAAPFDVTVTGDSGNGSLRKALLDAATTPGDDDVIVHVGLGTITVSGELAWSAGAAPNAVNIQGNGVHVDFGGASRGFVDESGRGVSIHDVTITGVGGSASTDAAPVLSEGGAVLLDHCTITGNAVSNTSGDAAGGVLAESGNVTIQDCTITGNTVNATGDGAGGVLAEGGTLDVSNSTISGNTVHAGGNVGGGFDAEGGAVTITTTAVACNHATSDGGDAGGGLLSESGTVTIDGSTLTGNDAVTSGSGLSDNQLLAVGVTPALTNTTVTDDTSGCSTESAGYLLPKSVKLKVNAKDATKSKLAATGFFDTGPGLVGDLTSAATLDVGGLHVDAASLTHKGKAFTLTSGGTTFKIVPSTSGSSHAKFALKATGDFTGEVAADGPLTLHFHDATVDGTGTVTLAQGKYALGKVRSALVAPDIYLLKAAAKLKGAGKDKLALLVGFATNGTTPAQASDVQIGFGGTFSATVPAAAFTKKGDVFTFKGNSGGVTKVVVNYARETIAVAGSGLDLGTFAPGGNPVTVTIGIGSDSRAVQVRMGLKGAGLKY
jgi:Right handed beta helix region